MFCRALAFWVLLSLARSQESQNVQAGTRRVYSVGDLHGDRDRFESILFRLGLADFTSGAPRWTGGTSVLVSTGDSVDRGEHSRAIYAGFHALAEQAEREGGEVVNVIGNHELMNLQNDLRYVPPSEFHPQGDYGGKDRRQKEWSLSGAIGQDLRKRFVAAAVREGTLFVHGGLQPKVLKRYSNAQTGTERLEALNQEMRQLFDREVVTFNHPLFNANGPFWNRNFAEDPEHRVCSLAQETLSLAGAKRMVMGHTPQETGVTTKCEGVDGPMLILGDTVISRAYEAMFGFTRMSAIEYVGDQVTAIYFPPGKHEVDRHVIHKVPRQEI